MSRQSEWIHDDIIKRNNYLKVEFKKLLTYSVLKNNYTPIKTKYILIKTIWRKSFYYTMTEQRARCRVCGRSHFVLVDAGLSRMQFRFFGGCGLLNGISHRGK